MEKTVGKASGGVLGEAPAAAIGRLLLVGEEEEAAAAAALLEEAGFSVERHGTADAVLAGDERPSLLVLCVEGSLAAAVKESLTPLRRAAPEVALVAVCEEIRPGEIRRALSAGVAGIVLARQLRTALAPCLAAVRAGQVCLPRPFARQVEPAALSMREKQIIGLVMMGYVNSQIAERLFIAESTVKSHLSSAFAKLGVGSRNEAVDLLLDADRSVGRSILGPGAGRSRAEEDR